MILAFMYDLGDVDSMCIGSMQRLESSEFEFV
jgi:hypothetical protein